MSATPIHGTVAHGFQGVADAFEANFADHGDIGAAVCVFHHGQAVVDLWGGWADREQGREWQHDTLQLVFSTTKGVAAACVHQLVERGVLDLDAPRGDVVGRVRAARKGRHPAALGALVRGRARRRHG